MAKQVTSYCSVREITERGTQVSNLFEQDEESRLWPKSRWRQRNTVCVWGGRGTVCAAQDYRPVYMLVALNKINTTKHYLRDASDLTLKRLWQPCGTHEPEAVQTSRGITAVDEIATPDTHHGLREVYPAVDIRR